MFLACGLALLMLLACGFQIREIETGAMDASDNALKNAPHTVASLIDEKWEHNYSRQQAAYPVQSLRGNKMWPTVGRLDDVHGDRNLVCTCEPMEVCLATRLHSSRTVAAD